MIDFVTYILVIIEFTSKINFHLMLDENLSNLLS